MYKYNIYYINLYENYFSIDVDLYFCFDFTCLYIIYKYLTFVC